MSSSTLEVHKALHVKGLLPPAFCQFFSHVLLRVADINGRGDNQVPNAKAVLDHEYMFETLHEQLWPVIEQIVGEPLIPTYAYARMYSNGDKLEKHTDRPACEVSVTIQLGRSHHYAWPIYMGNDRFDLAEGDGVIYSGCDVEHWREECNGPDGYYSGQVFLHFVRKNGEYTGEVGDASNRANYSYLKNRSAAMGAK